MAKAEGLIHVLPVSSCNHGADCRRAETEIGSNVLPGSALGRLLPNAADQFFVEDGIGGLFALVRAAYSQAVAKNLHRVAHILRVCAPLKVLRAVVRLDPILMVHVRPLGVRLKESRSYKAVKQVRSHVFRACGPTRGIVTTHIGGSLYDPSRASNSSQRTRAVLRSTGNLLPNFSHCSS